MEIYSVRTASEKTKSNSLFNTSYLLTEESSQVRSIHYGAQLWNIDVRCYIFIENEQKIVLFLSYSSVVIKSDFRRIT